MIWFILYLVLSEVITIAAMLKHPPKGRKREGGEWIIGIGMCWAVWPFALMDLLFTPKR